MTNTPRGLWDHSEPCVKCYLGWDDALNAALQITLKHMCFGQLLVPVGRQPDFGQRATFAEDKVSVEHRLSVFSPQGKRGRGRESGLERGNNTQRETSQLHEITTLSRETFNIICCDVYTQLLLSFALIAEDHSRPWLMRLVLEIVRGSSVLVPKPDHSCNTNQLVLQWIVRQNRKLMFCVVLLLSVCDWSKNWANFQWPTLILSQPGQQNEASKINTTQSSYGY